MDKGSVMFRCYDCIQEAHGTIWPCVFYCELDCLVYGVDVLQEANSAWMVKVCLQVSVFLFMENLVEPLFTYKKM